MQYIIAFLVGGILCVIGQLLIDKAGATVPLTGFGYTLAKGVQQAVNEKGFLGIFTGGLGATSGGITAAIIGGLIVSVIFSAKNKC